MWSARTDRIGCFMLREMIGTPGYVTTVTSDREEMAGQKGKEPFRADH
jgi:hypothetical protein